MQLHHALSLVAIASLGPLSAQPILDVTDNGPIPQGAPYAVTSYSTTVAADFYGSGEPGADQLYGFWMIPATGNRDMYFLDPAITGTSASFPGATVLSTNGGLDTLFWKVDANGVEQLGLRGGTEGIAPYTNGVLELKYPCTFNTTWNDAFSASLTVSGTPVTRAGTVDGFADGYGTIQLPGVEMDDVLRVKVRKVQVDQTLLGVLYRSYESYYFFLADVRYPVMKTSTDTVTINGGTPSVTWSADWLYGESEVGVQDLTADDVVFTPYPNPSNGRMDLNIGTSAVRTIEVLTTTGQVVMQERASNGGQLSGILDVSGLAGGVYQVRLTQADGRQGTQRIVVQ